MSEKRIGEKTYRVQPVLATKSIMLKLRIMKILGNGAARLPEIIAGAGDKGDVEKSASNGAAIAALSDIFALGDPVSQMNLLIDIAEMADIQGDSGTYNPVSVDRDFSSANLSEIYTLVFFVLKETYADFFSGLKASGVQNRMENTLRNAK